MDRPGCRQRGICDRGVLP